MGTGDGERTGIPRVMSQTEAANYRKIMWPIQGKGEQGKGSLFPQVWHRGDPTAWSYPVFRQEEPEFDLEWDWITGRASAESFCKTTEERICRQALDSETQGPRHPSISFLSCT